MTKHHCTSLAISIAQPTTRQVSAVDQHQQCQVFHSGDKGPVTYLWVKKQCLLIFKGVLRGHACRRGKCVVDWCAIIAIGGWPLRGVGVLFCRTLHWVTRPLSCVYQPLFATLWQVCPLGYLQECPELCSLIKSPHSLPGVSTLKQSGSYPPYDEIGLKSRAKSSQ